MIDKKNNKEHMVQSKVPKFLVVTALISFLLYSVLNAESKRVSTFKNEFVQEVTDISEGFNTEAKRDIDELLAKEQDYLTHYGIDISHYQGNIVEELKHQDKLDFIICKATQGIKYTDPDFDKNWAGIRQQGFIRGAYHFYNSSENAMDQAKHFTAVLAKWDKKDIAPILDIEQASLNSKISVQDLQKDLLVFLQQLEKSFKKRPVIYTDSAFAKAYLNNDKFARYPLWLADYTKNKQPEIPEVWKQQGFKIWQKSSTYQLDSKVVDFDIYNGLLSGLIE